MRARTQFAEQLAAQTEPSQAEIEQHLTDDLNREDRMLIHVLLAVSIADGKIHRAERKLIQKQYHHITRQQPDKKLLDKCFARINEKVEYVLQDLADESAKLPVRVKKLMFHSAVKVALADRKVYEDEIDFLEKISEALDLDEHDEDVINTFKALGRE